MKNKIKFYTVTFSIIGFIVLILISLISVNNDKNSITTDNIWNTISSGGKEDVTTEIQDIFNQAKNNDTIIIPRGTYLINGIVEVKEKNLTIKPDGDVKFIGKGEIKFTSNTSDSFEALNMTYGSNTIVASTTNFQTGDFIEVSGLINHTSYTPYRYKNLSYVAQVSEINNDSIVIDRNINYDLTDVTIKKIKKPYKLVIEKGITFDSIGLNVNYSINSKIDSKFQGFRGNNGNAITINQSTNFDININLENLTSTMGIVINNSNSFKANIASNNVGLKDGTGTKTLRGNGLQDAQIFLKSKNSYVVDSTIYGSRNITFSNETENSGIYAREINNINSNRSEAVQFSETDDLKITSNMKDIDDQALELLSVNNAEIYAEYISTLANSTEGAIVIKGHSNNISLYNPVIRCRNDYCIKVESLEGAKNIQIINPDIINYEKNKTGITVRDSKSPYNVKLTIIKGTIEAYSPITIYSGHNNITINGTNILSQGGTGISSLGDNIHIINATIDLPNIEDKPNAIISSGSLDTINKVLTNGNLVIQGAAVNKQVSQRYTNNNFSEVITK